MKILGTGISNTGTGKKILGTGIPVLEKNPGYVISNTGTGKKNPGYRDSKILVLEKNLGYRDFKSSTENRVESLYNRENFPGASRPSKTLTGVLIGAQNLSLGVGGVLL